MTPVAKLVLDGDTQMVKLPKGFHFAGTQVYLRKHGAEVILSDRPWSWENYFATARRAPEEFMTEVRDEVPPPRELF